MDNRKLQAESAPLFGWLPTEWAAFARGVIQAIVTAVLLAVIAYLESADNLPGGIVPWIPVVVMILRTIEGQIDKRSAEQ